MMSNNRSCQKLVVWLPALTVLILWIFNGPVSLRGLGRLAGFLGFTGMAIALVLASRAKWMESYFGGLDKIYSIHHKVGIAVFVCIILHPLLFLLSSFPRGFDRFVWFLFPVHRRWAVNLGSLAFWGMVLLLAITFLRRVPYDKWKISHKLFGIVFFLAFLHIFLADGVIFRSHYLNAFFLASFAMAATAFLFREFFHRILVKRFDYRVVKVRHLNDRIMEIELSPTEERLFLSPGQYVFFKFLGSGVTREAHPFTPCNLPEEDSLKIIVKALGDYTRRLKERLTASFEAELEGPYGRFDFRGGGKRQIWIAGGVGIVPFLCWARILERRNEPSKKIDLYYCVHDRDDAVHTEEFRRIEKKLDNFHFREVCTGEEGHLTISRIREENKDFEKADIFLCGPKRMTGDMTQKLIACGKSRSKIYFEDFEFR